MTKEATKIVIIGVESVYASIAKDVATFGLAFVLIWVGIYLQSSAMQWFGFIAACIHAVSAAVGERKRNTYSGQAAIDRVNEILGKE